VERIAWVALVEDHLALLKRTPPRDRDHLAHFLCRHILQQPPLHEASLCRGGDAMEVT
jgi:hypothetical protein